MLDYTKIHYPTPHDEPFKELVAQPEVSTSDYPSQSSSPQFFVQASPCSLLKYLPRLASLLKDCRQPQNQNQHHQGPSHRHPITVKRVKTSFRASFSHPRPMDRDLKMRRYRVGRGRLSEIDREGRKQKLRQMLNIESRSWEWMGLRRQTGKG